MARRNVHVPDELDKAMDKCKDANWSALACSAFEAEVRRQKEVKIMGTERSAIVERLRKSGNTQAARDRKQGKKLGAQWAAKRATAQELARLAAPGWDMTDWIEDDGFVCFCGVIDPRQDVYENRDDCGEFWNHETEETEPSLATVEGFVEGALEVWESLKGEI